VADTTRPPRTDTSPTGADWPAQVTDAVVGAVDNAKGKITGPATSAARGVVYGTLAAIVGTAVLVVVLVLAFRLTDIAVAALLELAGIEKAGRAVWIAHLLWGAGFALAGAAMLKKGRRPAPAT
jgi:hypothetical protein